MPAHATLQTLEPISDEVSIEPEYDEDAEDEANEEDEYAEDKPNDEDDDAEEEKMEKQPYESKEIGDGIEDT